MSWTPPAAMMSTFQTVGKVATSVGQIAAPFISAAGQKQQGIQEQGAYNYNAALADIQAKEIAASGEITQEELAERELSLRSTQEAMYAKAGVMLSGSALEVMLQSATDYEFDRSIARYNTAVKISEAQSQAQVQRYYGDLARMEGKAKSGMTLLGSIPKIAEGVGSIANMLLPKPKP